MCAVREREREREKTSDAFVLSRWSVYRACMLFSCMNESFVKQKGVENRFIKLEFLSENHIF
jgi:hypothetical protein